MGPKVHSGFREAMVTLVFVLMPVDGCSSLAVSLSCIFPEKKDLSAPVGNAGSWACYMSEGHV